MIKRFINRLLCNHQYGEPKGYFYDSGMSKFWVKKCDKCGREKVSGYL